MKYAGIGARKTPSNLRKEMTKIASFLEKYGCILRSGAAEGADSAFEEGVSSPDNCEIFLPWKGFSNSSSSLYTPSKEAFAIAKKFHPAWGRLSVPIEKLMARNTHQVLGANLDDHSKFVICWTPDGMASGGTGQAIRIALVYDIPVYNLFNEVDREDLRELCKDIKKQYLAAKNPPFKKHIQAGCFEPETCGGMCYGCCLAICSVCGGGEGTLPTHCPGVKLTTEQQDAIYCQGHDYTEEKGWHTTNVGPNEIRFHRYPVFEREDN
jgi:hypothetical protein